jgi:uncharacterized protein YndB with AHSA1/START domain
VHLLRYTRAMFTAVATRMIAAPAHKVWEALTNSEIIQRYLSNTEVISDWKIGSTIIYRGEWAGKQFEDTGTIINMIPLELLEMIYDNNQKLIFRLMSEDDGTRLIITQENIATEEEKDLTQANWYTALSKMREILTI